jgi:SPP1 gp7 family putative phage head morphogenesis protein
MLPPDFWASEQKRLLAILRPRLAQMAYEGSKQAAVKVGITFNPVLGNAQAVDYARAHTDALLNQLGSTSENLVGAALADWLEKPGAAIGDLQEKLKPAFGKARASVIAATETTRAYASGEMAAYQAEGYTQWTWVAHRDELACPICGKLAGQTVRIGQAFGEYNGESILQPPVHPNCRCAVKAWVKTGPGSLSTSAQFSAGQSNASPENIPEQPVERGVDIRQKLQKVDISVFERKLAEYKTAMRDLLGMMRNAKTYSEQMAITEKIRQLDKKRQEKQAEIIAEQRKVLYVAHPANMHVFYKDENIRSQKERLRTWKKSVAEFRKLVDASLIQDAVTIETTRRDRSYYYPGGYAKISRFDDVAGGIHELGHYLEESNPYVHDRAVAFLERRTSGAKLESLRQLTGEGDYRSSEQARQGNFVTPYMGKQYRDKSGNITATEIISAGMEYMWSDPVSFARKDPDYFDFLIDVLRGQA